MRLQLGVCCAFSLLLSVIAHGQELTPDDYAEAEAYIIQCATDWAETVVTGDMSRRKIYFADDFQGTGIDGSRYAKTEVTSGRPSETIRANEIGPIDVRFFGSTAIAYGEETWTAHDGSQGKFVWTDIWMLRDGSWQIIAAQDVEIPL